MPTHRIQLKGPWDVQRLDQNKPPVRVFMPAAWGEVFGDSPGLAQFRRKFNQPTNLEAHERVWIVFEGVGGEGLVRINGQELGTITAESTTAEFEVTQQLALHNELLVELTVVAESGPGTELGLWGAVVLEIRFESLVP